MTVLALSSHGYWGIALGIGLVAALVVAALLVMLIRSVRSIERLDELPSSLRSRKTKSPSGVVA